MGYSNNVYIGPYVKISHDFKYISETKETYPCCVNEHCKSFEKEFRRTFCPDCGDEICESERIIVKELRFDIHEFTEEHFDDCDMFCSASEYMNAYYIIGNRSCQSIASLDENEMIDIEKCIPEKIHEDWNTLKLKLTEQNIPYQFGIGVFNYTY